MMQVGFRFPLKHGDTFVFQGKLYKVKYVPVHGEKNE